ncbi:MAG: hypothetical protein WB424_15695 [Terracidiphilus sp.]
MTRKNVFRRLLYTVLAVLGVTGIYRFTRPVLFHWNDECVCTDYSPEVEGFTVWNPIRNRTPERSADHFLEDMRSGKVSAFAEPKLSTKFLSGKVPHTPIMRWELKDRENHGDLVFCTTSSISQRNLLMMAVKE